MRDSNRMFLYFFRYFYMYYSTVILTLLVRVTFHFIVYLDLINLVSLVSNLIGKRSLCALLHVANRDI